MIKALDDYLKDDKNIPSFHNKDELRNLTEALMFQQLCVIFTNKDIGEITKITDSYKIEKQAKVGSISPLEIIIPAGPTGMDASQIEYFQNLKIITKVVKNQLEIMNDTRILSVGQKITLSEINLMKKFDIKPFKHRISIIKVYLNGKVYDEGILKITNDYLKTRLEQGIKNVAAFGLATSLSNKASAPHVIVNAFQNIFGLANGTKVEISQMKGLSVAPVQAVQAEVKKEEPKKDAKKDDKKKKKEPEPEPEDDDIGGFGDMFG